MRRRLLVALVGLTMVVSGCAVVPTSGPINPAPGLPAGAGEPVVGVIARPPRAGMSQGDIVAGFLDAMASPTNNYEIAREYLTPSRALSWDPQLRTVVYDGPGSTNTDQDRNHIIHLTASRIGTIDSRRRWTAANPGDSVDVTFGLVQYQDSWRISSVPDGLLLTGGDLSRGYRGYPVYFSAPSGTVLVADGAVIPAESANTATILTQLLLDGPSDWLRGAVRSGFPSGTSLVLDSVPVINGVAQVSLTSRVLRATPAERTLLAAQLTATLAAVPGVLSVSITVAGQPLAIPDEGSVLSVTNWASMLPDTQTPISATFVGKKGPSVFTGGTVRPLKGAKAAGIVSNPIRNYSQTRIAGVRADDSGVIAFTSGADPKPLVGSGGVAGLQFDRAGRLWGVRGGMLYSWDSLGQTIPVIAASSVRIDRFALASDGVRIAVSRLVNGGTELAIGAVVRRSDGLHIQGLHLVSRNAMNPSDLAWIDSTHVVVLQQSPSPLIVNVSAISGENSAIISVPQALDITASARGGILVGTSNGTIWETGPTISQQVAVGTEPSYGQ